MSIISAEREEILTKRAFGHVATIGPDGEPQSTPVWIDWDGQYLLFSQTPTRQKYRNLARDPHVAVSVHDPDEPHRYVEIRGKVVSIEDDTNYAFINRMAKKYVNMDQYPVEPGEHRVILYVEPEHVTQQ